jgi:hypothetical protein
MVGHHHIKVIGPLQSGTRDLGRATIVPRVSGITMLAGVTKRKEPLVEAPCPVLE